MDKQTLKTDLVSKETNHPMDLIIMLVSEKSTRSSENNYIIQKASKEKPIVEVPHIDYFFGESMMDIQ